MAGGGSLGGGGRSKRGKSSKRKSKKRVGFVLDMTPLVDITFLLLTFFMFTTTMATPQVMEMKVPPEREVEVVVRESQLLSILVDDDGDLFFFKAQEDAEPLDMKDVRNLAIKENLNQINDLIIVLKVSENVEYGTVVQVLDELNLAEAGIVDEMRVKRNQPTFERSRKFTIADLTDEDLEKIAILKPQTGGSQ
ncbi:MAG: biopolymer transporter ExbD [Candidatus Kapaibacterium sp.]